MCAQRNKRLHSVKRCKDKRSKGSPAFRFFLVERKLFIASATASATTAPASATHISHITLPRPCFLSFCFRDHSATTFSKVSGCGWFHFLSFWPFAPSFPFILAFSFATFVCLGLGHFLKASAGGAVVWACLPSAVLPRSFRKTPKQNL